MTDESRRKLVKSAVVAAPAIWIAPVLVTATAPVHAQGTPTGPTACGGTLWVDTFLVEFEPVQPNERQTRAVFNVVNDGAARTLTGVAFNTTPTVGILDLDVLPPISVAIPNNSAVEVTVTLGNSNSNPVGDCSPSDNPPPFTGTMTLTFDCGDLVVDAGGVCVYQIN